MLSEYRTIPLTKGKVAIVDAADYDWLMQWNWWASKHRKSPSFYALSAKVINGRLRTLSMHRVILGLDFGDKRQGDHINHDTLDNRRTNLRVVTNQENSFNKSHVLTRKTSTGLKGIWFDYRRATKPWTVRVEVGDTRHRIQCDTKEEAIQARIRLIDELHGKHGYSDLRAELEKAQ
jgi:hypothetical protein